MGPTLHIEVCAKHSLAAGSERHPDSLVCGEGSKPARVQELLTLCITYCHASMLRDTLRELNGTRRSHLPQGGQLSGGATLLSPCSKLSLTCVALLAIW